MNNNFTGTLTDIRTALRKRTMKNTLYRTQPESGASETGWLWCYTGFMSEDDCRGFLNAIRPVPFIPNIDLMWTKQVIEYLMLTDDQCLDHRYRHQGIIRAEGYVNERLNEDDQGVPYTTKYVMEHTPREFWHMLPNSWTAKYCTPSKVLRIAVGSYYMNDFCKHIAEKLFIRAADLEDCMVPVTKLPPALPTLPKPQRGRVSNSITLRNFGDGTNISVAIKGGRAEVTRTETPAKPEVLPPIPRQNPAAHVVPVFASHSDCVKYWKSPEGKAHNKEINEAIQREYKGFGGSKKGKELAEELHLTLQTFYDRASAIRKAAKAAEVSPAAT